jgi:hypothetical protein
MSSKQSLSATNLAVHQHLECDLFIHNVYNRSTTSTPGSPSELANAHFKRGIDWESSLYSWLDQSNLLLKVPSIPLEPQSLLENILADDRRHFFITGLIFCSPNSILKPLFVQSGNQPLNFGMAKPDLLEIKRIGDEIHWRVIDAKASKHVKVWIDSLFQEYP